MQRIAAEMAFSESTFIYPAAGAGDVRMRIFTPGEELPMAGHPTIGSTFALASEGVIARGRDRFVFELGVGPIDVALEWNADGLSFAWMTQLLPTFGRTMTDRAALASAIGVAPADLAGSPPQVVSCGVPFFFVPLVSRRAVDAVAIDRRALARAYADAEIDELPTFVFTTESAGGSEALYSRMVAPGFGIAEDPATGAASGPLGCYVLRNGLVTPERARGMVSLQGVAMKRPSRIHIAIEGEPTAITRVRVGGQSVLIGKGVIEI